MKEQHGRDRQWGQLTSKPSTGNVFLNVLKKEDLKEKCDCSMREPGDRDINILAGGRRVTASFVRALKGKFVFAASVYVMLIKVQSFERRSLQLFIPQNTAKNGIAIITLGCNRSLDKA